MVNGHILKRLILLRDVVVALIAKIRLIILSLVIREKSKKCSFALNNIDINLAKCLNVRHGFFIEAGANDGVTQSNTLYFEKYKKWRGLLIEPIPELAEKCKVNRPNCIVENCALVSSDYDKETIEIRYANLMSVVKGGLKDANEENIHIAKGLEIQDIPATYTVTVPARTLSSILDQYNIKNVDLLSLDVEGYELEALKGIDFNKSGPKYMLIEARYVDEIESFIGNIYEKIANLSHHDILYKLKPSFRKNTRL